VESFFNIKTFVFYLLSIHHLPVTIHQIVPTYIGVLSTENAKSGFGASNGRADTAAIRLFLAYKIFLLFFKQGY